MDAKIRPWQISYPAPCRNAVEKSLHVSPPGTGPIVLQPGTHYIFIKLHIGYYIVRGPTVLSWDPLLKPGTHCFGLGPIFSFSVDPLKSIETVGYNGP